MINNHSPVVMYAQATWFPALLEKVSDCVVTL